jgi:hypothetical protein
MWGRRLGLLGATSNGVGSSGAIVISEKIGRAVARRVNSVVAVNIGWLGSAVLQAVPPLLLLIISPSLAFSVKLRSGRRLIALSALLSYGHACGLGHHQLCELAKCSTNQESQYDDKGQLPPRKIRQFGRYGHITLRAAGTFRLPASTTTSRETNIRLPQRHPTRLLISSRRLGASDN